MSPQGDVAWIHYARPAAVSPEAPRAQRNLQVFDWVWITVDTYYYDSGFHGVDWSAASQRHRPAAEAAVDDDQLYHAINAMLAELQDSHTYALSPRDVAESRERRWVWIGLDYAPLKGTAEKVVVTQVWAGGSAKQAGVLPGWILETCDGQGARTFLGQRHLQNGQRVTCAFIDEKGHPREVELVARPLSRTSPGEARVLADGSVYVRFDRFEYAEARWLYHQLENHGTAPAVILDQRYNTGGDLAYLEYVAGLFFPQGVKLGTALRHDQAPSIISSRRPFWAPRYDGRLAVIVSAGTASAAEIFSNAVKYYHRGVIVGQTTAGHVLNAYQGDLPGGGRLSFTIRDICAPDGRRLEGAGVASDVVIEYRLGDLLAGRDSGIDAALVALRRAAVAADN